MRKDEKETYAMSGNVDGLKNHDEGGYSMGKVKVWKTMLLSTRVLSTC